MLFQGPHGWVEFAPFVEYADAEAAVWLTAAIEAGWAAPPDPVRDTVPVNATVPAVAAGDVDGVLSRFSGCHTAKVKVAQRGQHLSDDIDRVAAVRAHLGQSGRVRVDANGGWDLQQARTALGALSAYDLEYAEQPVAQVEDLARLRVQLATDQIDVPIAADESIRRARDPLLVARLEAADIIVIKVAPLGGATAALRVVAECGLPAVVSSALDTSVGMAAGFVLAAALPSLDHACGLGTVALLDGDVSQYSMLPSGGVVTQDRAVRARGSVSPELLERYRADEATSRWWVDRLKRCLRFT